MKQDPYPNPKDLARFGNPFEEMGEGRIWTKSGAGELQGRRGWPGFDGGGGARAGREARHGEIEEKGKENCRPKLPGAGFMRPPRSHRTHLKWHRTRPVTTRLMRREVCILALHRTMGTGRWL